MTRAELNAGREADARRTARLVRVALRVLLGDLDTLAFEDSRDERVVAARSIVVLLLREHTVDPPSFPLIARALGRENHSSAMTSYRRLSGVAGGDPACAEVLARWAIVRDRAFVRPWLELRVSTTLAAYRAWSGAGGGFGSEHTRGAAAGGSQ